ncbi:MFS transporter [Halobacterium rubrum]|uniref:MFS transporter n=1 Tax=Halobacterium TaxID=2239 RepID=UPI001F182748|nr:MFS transporter [Halobacterium rubrum]MDH5021257.1 MFS transporter [Halobacterium rubrum]
MNRNDRAIVGLVALAHATVHTYELSIPILIPIWLDVFPVTQSTLGVVVATGYALFGLGALPGGVLSDTVGSQRLIIGCLVAMAGAFVALSLAPSIPVVGLALVAWGAAASVYHPAGLSLISTGVEERADGFAYHGIAGNLGIALGPLVVTLLLLVADWRAVTAALAVPAVVAGVVASRVELDEHAAAETDSGDDSGETAADGGGEDAAADGGSEDAAGDGDSGDAGGRSEMGVTSLPEFLDASKTLLVGPFAAVFVVVVLSGLYYRGVLTFLPEVLSAYPSLAPVEVAGRQLQPYRYVYAGLLLVGVGGQYTGGKLAGRFETEPTLAVAFGVLAALSVVFLPAAGAGLLPLLVAGVFLGFALFVVQPLYQTTVAEYTPAGTRGLSYGYTYLGVFGVGAIGAAVAGSILEFGSLPVLFAVLAGFALTAAATAAWLSSR